MSNSPGPFAQEVLVAISKRVFFDDAQRSDQRVFDLLHRISLAVQPRWELTE